MKAYIQCISYYLPEQIVTNDKLIQDFPEWNADKVSSKTGILERHISASDETASDMAEKAALQLFRENSISPDEIDFILFCTQSPDYFLPTTACLLQNKLGIPVSAGALDYNLGCSGYIYGLALAKGLVCAGIAKNILLLTAETYNKYIHPKDKGNRSLFGDGAAATIVSTKGWAEIRDFVLGTDGSGAENLIVRTGASRHRKQKEDLGTDEGGYIQSSDYLYMNGSEIFNFTLEAVPALVEQILKRNEVSEGDIDMYVFHQANKFMLSTIRKVCGIDKEQFYIDLSKKGNTVSSTIPIALKDLLMERNLKPGNKIMIAGFGVGYSWGGTLLRIV
ncbi:3-oxoacyl-ACP synthase III family protein [Bacteroides congonensis]